VTREDDVAAVECALARACMECNTERDWVKVVWQDYWARLCASTVGHQCCLDFD
jgi:hypothetical protein